MCRTFVNNFTTLRKRQIPTYHMSHYLRKLHMHGNANFIARALHQIDKSQPALTKLFQDKYAIVACSIRVPQFIL